MPFNGWKAPLKPKNSKRQKYVVPTRASKHYKRVQYLTPELEEEFRRLYPITFNEKMMELFGISFSTLHRFARSLGLKKDMAVIKKKHVAQIKRTCTKNGYYESIKGKKPPQAAIEATRKKRAEGFCPIRKMQQDNPTGYRRMVKKAAKKRMETLARDRRRYELTLMPHTNFSNSMLAGMHFTHREANGRYYARRHGYIPGNPDPELGERHVMYYTEQTQRCPDFEKNRTEFEFKPYNTRQQNGRN